MVVFTAPGKSTIFINPKGWIEVAWGETIDKEEYIFTAEHMVNMEVQMVDDGLKPRMMIDFSRFKNITSDAATLASSATKGLMSEKIAGFGISPVFQGILDTIKTRSTRTDIIREFPTREGAEAWLMEK